LGHILRLLPSKVKLSDLAPFLVLFKREAKKPTPNALRTKEDMPILRGGGSPPTCHTATLKKKKKKKKNHVTITPPSYPTKDNPKPCNQSDIHCHFQFHVISILSCQERS
jgi:hypothetical protein